jgi:hypothetical protein
VAGEYVQRLPQQYSPFGQICRRSAARNSTFSERKLPQSAPRSASGTLRRVAALTQTGFNLIRRQNQIAFAIGNPDESNSAAQQGLSLSERVLHRRAGSLHRGGAHVFLPRARGRSSTFGSPSLSHGSVRHARGKSSHCYEFSGRLGIYLGALSAQPHAANRRRGSHLWSRGSHGRAYNGQ